VTTVGATTERPQASSSYRADVDGLRAVAVLLVVGYHAFSDWVKAGFIGVDVFFVISGFLISGIIFARVEQGSFSFAEFYSRRIRRIFPSLITLLLACLAVGWFVLFSDELQQLGRHLIGGAGFFSNLLLWRESGYFDTSAESKPLLHLWSLGIEEQFYIVWPLFLYWSAKRKWSQFRFILLVAAISFAINVLLVHRLTVATFYSPVTRFWELMAGALLALSARRLSWRWPGADDARALVGLALLAIALVSLDRHSAFPGAWALLPVLGTVLLISAPQSVFNRRILSNRSVVWCGAISYPLYLWHWPLLSFARIAESGAPSARIRLAAVALSFLLAWLTYRFVETPLRFGGRNRAKVWSLAVALALVGIVGGAIQAAKGFPSRLKGLESARVANVQVVESTESCKAAVPIANPRYCRLNDPAKPPTVVLLGDSHANRLFSAFADRFAAGGDNLLQLGGGGCLPFWGIETGQVGQPNHCDEQMPPQLDYILQAKSIRTVILLHRGPLHLLGYDPFSKNRYFVRDTAHPTNQDRVGIYQKGLRDALERFSKAGKRVFILIDEPELDFDPHRCQANARPFTLTHSRAACRMSRADVDSRNRSYIDITSAAAKELRATVVNLQNELCDQDYCYAGRDGQLWYQDADHLSPSGAEYVVGRLWEEFR
jgi:peptidoglycan/LPS O-acetylase OafA/YrhL